MALREAVAEKPVKTIDILPNVEKFPPYQRKFLLKNLIAIEMNRGCSSGCADCAVGVEDSVTSAIGFDSFVTFVKTYKEELPTRLGLHYGTEPFDYNDGAHGIADVYKAIKENRPDVDIYLSTYFPQGSEHEMAKLATEMIKNSVDQNRSPEILRISIRQTGQEARQKERQRILERIKIVRKIVEESLGEEKYQAGISAFFEDSPNGEEKGGLNVMADTKTRMPLHKAFAKSDLAKADSMQSSIGIASADGVVFGPNGFRGVFMDALNIKNRTGLTQKEIEPGPGFEAPEIQGSDYSTEFGYAYEDLQLRGMMKPIILLPAVKIFRDGPGEQLISAHKTLLSRDIRTFRTFFKTICDSSVGLREAGEKFLTALYWEIKDEYTKRKQEILNVLGGTVSEEQQFYIEPITLYLKLFDHLFGTIDQRRQESGISGKEIVDIFANAATLKSADIIALTSSTS